MNNPRSWRPCSQAVPKTSRRFALETHSRSYWTYIPILGGEAADHHNTLIGMLVDGLAHTLTEFTRVRSSPVGLMTPSSLLTVLLPAACPLHDPFSSPLFLGQCHNPLDTHKLILSTQYHNLHVSQSPCHCLVFSSSAYGRVKLRQYMSLFGATDRTK